MIQIESKHPAGTVSYITANHPRYQKFYDSLERLNVPKGTILAHETNYNAARNRNVCIAGMQGDWILFIDDDQVFESDSLIQHIAELPVSGSRGIRWLGRYKARSVDVRGRVCP